MNRTISSLLVLLAMIAGPALMAQTLTGVVSDENGAPMPGATIVANGGARGVSTDMDGRYSLSLGTGDHTVDFSFVGYVKVTRKVTLAEARPRP